MREYELSEEEKSEIIKEHGSIKSFNSLMRFDDYECLIEALKEAKAEAKSIGYGIQELLYFDELLAYLIASPITEEIKQQYDLALKKRTLLRAGQ